jgi:hypothetical protein
MQQVQKGRCSRHRPHQVTVDSITASMLVGGPDGVDDVAQNHPVGLVAAHAGQVNLTPHKHAAAAVAITIRTTGLTRLCC